METIILKELSDYEIERGKPMPSRLHSITQINLGSYLVSKYRKKFEFTSELNIALPNIKIFIPDLCIFPQKPIDWGKDETAVSEPPLTTIEIISGSQTIEEMLEKFEQYFAGGVQSCWLVIPSLQTIYVIQPNRKIDVFRDELLTDSVTGIEVDLKEIFGTS